MSEEVTTKERFLSNVAKHQMTLELDNGVHRSIKFGKPESSHMCFRLNTWPGCLSISGDMGCFVFRRVEDMFRFFRNDKLNINPYYYEQKLEGIDRRDGYEEFSHEKYDEAIKEEFDTFFESNPDYAEWKDKCWKELDYDLIGRDDLSGPERLEAAYRFSFKDFNLQQLDEHSMREYTTRFIWCLYAIVWGIKQYDEQVEEVQA